MKSFLSLILEDGTGVPWGDFDEKGNPRQGDLFKGKFPDPKKAAKDWEFYKSALSPNLDPKDTPIKSPEALADELAKNKPAPKPASKSTKSVDDILQDKLREKRRKFDDMLTRSGIDPHSGELDATRAAKAQAKTAERKVAKEMKSAAKLTPKDIDMIKKLEGRPGMQRSLGMLGKEDLDSGLRQAHFSNWRDRSHANPTRVSAAGSPQGAVRSGSLQGAPKPAPRTPPLFDPEAVHGGTVRSGSLQAQSRQSKEAIEALRAATKEVKGQSLGTKLGRAGAAALRSPLGRIVKRAVPVVAGVDAAFRIKRGYEAVTDPDLSAREKAIAVGRELPGGEAAFIRAGHETERVKQALERSKRTGEPYVQPRGFGPKI